MPVTQIPPRDPSAPPATPAGSGPQDHRDLFEAQHWETAYRRFNPEDVPHLLIQLQDDLSRARKREAIWLSIILHLFVVILLWNSDKIAALLPHRAVPLDLRAATDREKNATFLELPPDEQKTTQRPDSKIISDKDRVASSKTPQINREELKKLLQSTRPARPGPMAPPAPPQAAQSQAPPPPQQQQPQTSLQPAPQQGSGFSTPQQNDQTAQLRTPPVGSNRPAPNFNNTMTPGSAIEQAAQAAAANHGRYGGAQAGDYGFPGGRGGAKALDQAEILTDTLGVDFGPYLTRVVQEVKEHWYQIMPESVYPPIYKQGKLAIEFVILKNGTVAGMILRTPSGDVALDRAAWGSITGSSPFPPLPREFVTRCPQPSRDESCNLGLRFYYFYNLEIDKDLR
jgi:TonB family protein